MIKYLEMQRSFVYNFFLAITMDHANVNSVLTWLISLACAHTQQRKNQKINLGSLLRKKFHILNETLANVSEIILFQV